MSDAPRGVFAASGERPRSRPRINLRYSRFVALMKLALPVAALGLLLLVSTWPRLESVFQSVHLTPPRFDADEARDLRMVQARYSGFDRENRPYVITADVARQSPSSDDLIAMEGPKGTLTTATGGWVELTAVTGVYRSQVQLLDLFGDVHVSRDKGEQFESDNAHVDMKAGSAGGDDPVTGHGPFGEATGDGFRIFDHGSTMILTGHATLLLRPHAAEAQ
jgi:lipopolysaccharide export system protein LptC